MPTKLCSVDMAGQRRDITDTDIERLIASDSKLMVQVAEGFGRHIARDVSSSHIRNIYGSVKQMEMTEFNYHFPFAPSISRFLNFKLPVESSPQSQPLQDFLL
jgi:hypothetical protein